MELTPTQIPVDCRTKQLTARGPQRSLNLVATPFSESFLNLSESLNLSTKNLRFFPVMHHVI